MERREFHFAPSFDLNSVHFNTQPAPADLNVPIVLRSFAHLPFAFNSAVHAPEIPELAENVLGKDRYRTGLDGALNDRGERWP
jgi:hypothetical protein